MSHRGRKRRAPASASAIADRDLRSEKERLEEAIQNIPHGVCMFDHDRRLLFCNHGYQALYNLPVELTRPGVPLESILSFRQSHGALPADMSSYFDVIGESKAAGFARSRSIPLVDGRVIRITHNPMGNGSYVAIHEDISETVQAREQIRLLGLYDALTGLPNRVFLKQKMAELISAARQGNLFYVIYIDLDRFKAINDTYGHAVGDVLLKLATSRLQSCLDVKDTLARVGGDEFVALRAIADSDHDAPRVLAHIVELMKEPFQIENVEVFIGASVGAAICPRDGLDADTLLKNADVAMYEAKCKGRSAYCLFDEDMEIRNRARQTLETELRRALENQEFELHYQPQLNVKSETITVCEALARWRHPVRGLLPPSEFIPFAEQSGLIIALGDWVIRRACHDAATWPEHIGVAVNVSAVQFNGLGLIKTVTTALQQSGLAPSRLEIEITESVLLNDKEHTLAALQLLRGLGVRIAMDDFGTGYSSLSYLRSFPFDKLKIDRAFVKDVNDREEALAIVKAIAGLGAALGMATTAEGIETLAQLESISAQGCTQAQGFYFGRPCTNAALRQVFAQFAITPENAQSVRSA